MSKEEEKEKEDLVCLGYNKKDGVIIFGERIENNLFIIK
tara:strand:+ start:178 stop:294 length:117 start_codon:yes stop_codon:yes gene_type:complete